MDDPKDYEINDKIRSSGSAMLERNEAAHEAMTNVISEIHEKKKIHLNSHLASELKDECGKQMAKRDKMENVRYDLVSPYMIESLAKTFAEGNAKYGPNNWRKGLLFSNCLNHAMNHLMKYAMGDASESHLDHAFWNIGAMIEFRETGRETELNDLFFHQYRQEKMVVPAGLFKPEDFGAVR